MAAPGFWNDQDSAQQTTSQLSALNAAIKPLAALVKGGDDLEVLIEFAEEDDSDATENEIRQHIEELHA